MPAIYVNDGTVNTAVVDRYAFDGTTNIAIKERYANDGTANHLVFSGELVLYDTGSQLVPWTGSKDGDAGSITFGASYVEMKDQWLNTLMWEQMKTTSKIPVATFQRYTKLNVDLRHTNPDGGTTSMVVFLISASTSADVGHYATYSFTTLTDSYTTFSYNLSTIDTDRFITIGQRGGYSNNTLRVRKIWLSN